MTLTVPSWLGSAAVLNAPSSGNDAAVGEVVKGSDSRLSNARTPTAHASTHAAVGSDPVTPAAIGALSATAPVLANIPDPTTGAAGQVWTTDSVNGSWATPAGGGMSIQTWNLGDGSVIAPNGSPFTWGNCGTVTTIWINGFFTLAPITVSAFGLSMHTPGDGSAIWVGAIYAANARGKPGALLWQSPAQDATVGGMSSRQTVSVSPTVTLQPGLYWLAIGVSGWTSTHPSPNKTVGPTPVSVQSSWNSWGVAHEARSTVWNGTFSGTFPATASTSIAGNYPPSPWIGLTASYA